MAPPVGRGPELPVTLSRFDGYGDLRNQGAEVKALENF